MAAPYSALTIAKWFIAWANAEDADLSNLKLQKLLYYAQGWHLALRGGPLFPDAIQAWSHGPVVSCVYHEYKSANSSDLVLADDEFDWAEVDSGTSKFLISIWNTYGGFGAWRLRNMTHEEQPWKTNFKDNARSIVIPVGDMKRFFETLRPSGTR